MCARAEFTTLTKLRAMARYIRCPGVFELGIKCGNPLGRLDNIEFDHIKRNEIEPDNSPENCRPLCRDCHAAKTTRKDAYEAAKGRLIRKETKASQARKRPPMPGTRASGIRKRMNGTVEKRS